MSSHLTAHRDGEGEKADIGKELWERGPYQSICIFQNVREGRKVIQWEASSEIRHMAQTKRK